MSLQQIQRIRRGTAPGTATPPVPLWVWAAALGAATVTGLAVTKPALILALLGAIGLGALVRRIFLHPHEGFVYALAFFPFYTISRGIVLTYNIPIPLTIVGLWTEGLLAVMMTSILCQRIRGKEKLRVTWDDMWMVLLVLSTVYGAVISFLQHDFTAVVYGFHQSVTSFLFFFVARWLKTPPGYLKRLMRVWLISFGIIAVLSFAQYALRPAFITKIVIVMRPGFNGAFEPYDFYAWYPRMYSLFFGEQFWGTVCAFVACYCIVSLFQKGNPLGTRLLLWSNALLSVAGLLCSMSRGAMVCFVVSLLVLLCFRGPHRRALAVFSLVLALLAGFVLVQFNTDNRVKSLVSRTNALLNATDEKSAGVDEHDSAVNRMWQWERAWKSFPLYPAGRGLGRAGSAAILHNSSIDTNDAVSDGGYFRLLAEVGLPGTLGFLAGAAGVLYVLLFRLLKERKNVQGEDRVVALTLYVVLWGMLIQNIGGDNFDYFYIIPLLWFLFGLLLSRRDARHRERQHQNGQPGA